MALQAIGAPEPQPDGTFKQWYFDSDTGQTTFRAYGTPQDRVAQAQGRAAEVKAYYDDPWIQENVLGPTNRATEEMYKEKAKAFQLEAIKLLQQGRRDEATAMYNRAQITLRAAEMAQTGMFKSADLFLKGAQPAYASQFIDLARMQPGFQPRTGSFADIAAGKLPQGVFGAGMKEGATTVNDVLFGSGGGPSFEQLAGRNAADEDLAGSLAAGIGQIPRGSLESLDPYEQEYLGSLWSSKGYNPDVLGRAYKRAGIMQGPGVSGGGGGGGASWFGG